MTPTDLLTTAQVAELLQESAHTTARRLGGEIPSSKVGRKWLTRRADVDAYLEARRTTAKVRPRRARGKRASP